MPLSVLLSFCCKTGLEVLKVLPDINVEDIANITSRLDGSPYITQEVSFQWWSLSQNSSVSNVRLSSALESLLHPTNMWELVRVLETRRRLSLSLPANRRCAGVSNVYSTESSPCSLTLDNTDFATLRWLRTAS